MNGRFQCFAQVAALVLTIGMTDPIVAQSRSGGLQGSPGLGGAGRLGAGSGGLRTTRLQPAARQQGSRLQAVPARSSQLGANQASLRNTAANLARGGLSTAKLKGAASSIPPSQIGALLFDVARELEAMEADMTDVAVGYYMAALADPQGDRYDEAKRRLHGIFLEGTLSHEEAVGLYAVGKSIFKDLSQPRIGLTRGGLASARRDLEDLKSTYHRRRKSQAEVGSATADPGAVAGGAETE